MLIDWVLVHWESAVLAILPLLAIHFCWGFRENMQVSAWLFFAVFVALFFASNSWRFVPLAENPTLEDWRIWFNDARLTHAVALKGCAVLAVAACFVAFVRGETKGASLLMLATVLVAMFGEWIESSYCSLRDPMKGMEHVYKFEGGRHSVCGRLAEFGISPWFAWVGVWLTPAITVIPSIATMAYIARKKRAGT